MWARSTLSEQFHVGVTKLIAKSTLAAASVQGGGEAPLRPVKAHGPGSESPSQVLAAYCRRNRRLKPALAGS